MQYKKIIKDALPSPEQLKKMDEEAAERRKESWEKLESRADEISIIDFHTHIFPKKIAKRALEHLTEGCRTIPFTGGTEEELRASMKEAGIGLSVSLPVITNPEKVIRINFSAAVQNEKVDETGILSFAGMHPAAENYRALLNTIKRLGFKGIKLHPDFYRIPFDDIQTKRIVDYASELDLIVVTHAGTDIGLYPPVFCTVDSIVNVVKDVRPAKLVAAHMGGWNNWDEVLDKLAGMDLWYDTAFSIGEIPWDAPDANQYHFHQLEDEAFVELVHKMGVDRVLFATDSPWAEQKDYVNRIDGMPLSKDEKRRIFAGNAKRLLGL